MMMDNRTARRRELKGDKRCRGNTVKIENIGVDVMRK
jgi:hypothetical protein